MRTSLTTEILVRGEPAINEIIAERREETLHLEFKTLSSNGGLNRDDRKMIAKAVCGFANAEGGLLIVGIGTTRIDGIDTASNIVPIRGLNRVRNLVIAAVPELLSPQHNSISVHAMRPGHAWNLLAPLSGDLPVRQFVDRRVESYF